MAAKTVSVTLNSGYKMPLLGLGTWQLDKGRNAVDIALEVGYRHIDTAFLYQNEEEIGSSIARWVKKDPAKNRREDLFVTTKLPMNGMTPDGVEKFVRKSLAKLQLTYVDLFLIHTPVGVINSGDDDSFFDDLASGKIKVDFGTNLIAIWKAMEAIADKGFARSIGVSNFSIPQMRKMLAIARIPPAVNQVEAHLRYQQPQSVQFCKDNHIVVTSYGSLGSPGRKSQPTTLTSTDLPDFLEHPVVQLVADNHGVATTLVALKFWVQQGVVVIPKSSNQTRIEANSKLFDWALSDTEMAALRTLDRGLAGKSFSVFEDSVFRQHPEFQENY